MEPIMPAAGFLAIAALAAISYFYIGRPIAHGVKRAGQAVVHVVHKPKKEKPKK